MSSSAQYSVFATLLWGAAICTFGYIGWLAFKYRKHFTPATVLEVIDGKKKEIDPELARSWEKEVKRFRLVGGAIWLAFMLLAIGVSVYNTLYRK